MPQIIWDMVRYGRRGGGLSVLGYLRSGVICYYKDCWLDCLDSEDLRVHILTGSERVTMALWMAASWVATTGRQWRFIVHDDGTLRPSDVRRLEKRLPGCRVLLAAESDAFVQRATVNHPLCWRVRNLHPLSRKLVDMPLYAGSGRLVTIDTDILFYKRPERLLQWIDGDAQEFVFMRDVADAAVLAQAEVQAKFGVSLLKEVNTGIVCAPAGALTLDRLEEWLGKVDLWNQDRWFIEQTLYALAASVWGRSEFLGPEYVMDLAPWCGPDAVARHYVGAIRHQFYAEGIGRVDKLLKETAARHRALI